MKNTLQIALVLLLTLAFSLASFGQAPNPKSQSVAFVNSPDISSPPGYTHAVVVNSGKMIFISGQVGLDKEGKMAGKDDFRAQANQAFLNLKAALAAAGAKPEHLVKLNYYVVGLNHEKLVTLRKVRDAFINKTNPPASTLAGVAALFRDDAQIEIEAVAAIP